MNSIQKLLACLMLGLLVIGYGCKKDDDDPVGCANWAADVSAEATAFSNAATVYFSNPTPTLAECQAYKNAGQAYVNALNAHVECATISGNHVDLQAAINQIQADVNAIQC